jgi:phosphatidylinositol 4-kinase
MSFLGAEDLLSDRAQSGAETPSCPESPSPHRHALDLNESEGRSKYHTPLSIFFSFLFLTYFFLFWTLPRIVPHGLLTPRTPTPSIDFGKEMMADMIATLIDSQQNNLLTPPLDHDNNHANASSKNSGKSGLSPQTTDRENKSERVGSVQPPSDRNNGHIGSMSSRKISALGTVFLGQANPSSGDFTKSAGLHLSANGQFRRDVLFAIMERGMRGNNIIGKGAATAARRAIQAMDRKRAISLMNGSATESDILGNGGSDERNGSSNASNDEDKVMEALRLLIIQSHAAKENLSSQNAVKAVRLPSNSADLPDRNHKGVDAGEVDKRLAGCGEISSSLLSALRLWKGGIVSNGELLELVQKDLQFLKQSAAFGSLDESKLIEDSAFWGRFSFGERWAEKKARLAASSPHGSSPDWDLTGCIVKSNDDLRQEAFVMQLIVLCDEAFRTAGLDLWVNPYTIVATGLSTGIIECVRDAMSFDSLKKRPGYGTDGLVGHFTRMAEIAADPFKALNESKLNFVRSLAAYSLMSYLFLFKDRHNGNLLLDTAGHVIHIDFGFVFGIAPGGSFSLEQSTPFKLTDEMLEVMGGLGSPLFSEFVTLFCCGFLALQAHADTFLTVVEVTCRGSSFHCFDGKDPDEVVTMLGERFCPDLNKSQTVAYALDLIKFATTSYGTTSYDYFQYLSQGIAT